MGDMNCVALLRREPMLDHGDCLHWRVGPRAAHGPLAAASSLLSIHGSGTVLVSSMTINPRPQPTHTASPEHVHGTHDAGAPNNWWLAAPLTLEQVMKILTEDEERQLPNGEQAWASTRMDILAAKIPRERPGVET